MFFFLLEIGEDNLLFKNIFAKNGPATLVRFSFFYTGGNVLFKTSNIESALEAPSAVHVVGLSTRYAGIPNDFVR